MQAVQTVKAVLDVQTVQAVQTVQVVQTVQTVQTVLAVQTVTSFFYETNTPITPNPVALIAMGCILLTSVTMNR